MLCVFFEKRVYKGNGSQFRLVGGVLGKYRHINVKDMLITYDTYFLHNLALSV
jgi:hypothetical protein